MAGEIRNLQVRGGRYFAHMAVPENLRASLGKRELRGPIGPDKRAALRKLPIEVAKFVDVFAAARRASGIGTLSPRRALSAVELAHLHYDEMLERDEMARNSPREEGQVSVPSWNWFIGDVRLKALARVVSGEACDDEIGALATTTFPISRLLRTPGR